MGSVGSPVVRRMIEVAITDHDRSELLASVGLTATPPSAWAGESVADDVYYDLLERIVAPSDIGFPGRYGAALAVDDLGALGLALKTAPSVADALARLARYVLVLSDTLEYRVEPTGDGVRFHLEGRPAHRRGAGLANECALAAVVSMVRQIADRHHGPRSVRFRHPAPSTSAEGHDPAPADRSRNDPTPDGAGPSGWFGCPVHHEAGVDALDFGRDVTDAVPVLADQGLSAYLLGQLDAIRSRTPGRSFLDTVRAAVADGLPDGQPSKAAIARRLAMSERTLHRRLADQGATFHDLATDARRTAAVALLDTGDHTLVDIAFLTGFSDQTAFTRAFKRWTGHTPAAYRASLGR